MQPTAHHEVVEVVDGVTYACSSAWTKQLESEEHWRLYHQQQELMNGLIQPGYQVMEIGHGTGFKTNYLRSKGIGVSTVDLDSGKGPDIVTYDFPDKYDAIRAFEVFEHIPFEKFREILPRIASACRHYLFFSVPCNKKTAFSFELKLPKFRPFGWKWIVKRGRPMSSNHYWEIDYAGVSLADLVSELNRHGLMVERRGERLERMFFACKVT